MQSRKDLIIDDNCSNVVKMCIYGHLFMIHPQLAVTKKQLCYPYQKWLKVEILSRYLLDNCTKYMERYLSIIEALCNILRKKHIYVTIWELSNELRLCRHQKSKVNSKWPSRHYFYLLKHRSNRNRKIIFLGNKSLFKT